MAVRRGLPVVVIVCLVLALGVGARAQQETGTETVVVEGNPPLTQGMIAEFLGFMEWLLDVPLTVEQRTDVGTGMVEFWKTGDDQEKQGTLNVLAVADQIGQRTEAERALLRETLQAQLLEALRQMPEDPTAKWMLGIYEAGHQPIAAGDPPLTRQVADAFAELMCFMIGQVIGQEVPVPDDYREAAAELLSTTYPDMAAEQQRGVSQLPIVWAAMRVEWDGLSEDERDQYRAQWRVFLQGSVPEEVAAHAPAEPAADAGDDESLKAIVDRKLREDPLYQNMTSQFMSNLLQTQHNGNMAMLYNMGGSGWTYRPGW